MRLKIPLEPLKISKQLCCKKAVEWNNILCKNKASSDQKCRNVSQKIYTQVEVILEMQTIFGKGLDETLVFWLLLSIFCMHPAGASIGLALKCSIDFSATWSIVKKALLFA